jgi:hypothetical protein
LIVAAHDSGSALADLDEMNVDTQQSREPGIGIMWRSKSGSRDTEKELIVR